MIAYVDSSVLLRVLLGQHDRLTEWGAIALGVASVLTQVECLRTLDRLRLKTGIQDDEVALRREVVYRLTAELEIVDLDRRILGRASQPFPTALGTLDAIHLATALLWREIRGEELVMATHDRALATAARASGLQVVGV